MLDVTSAAIATIISATTSAAAIPVFKESDATGIRQR